ncbi:PRD domain-containing protein [Streptomyces hygroscopicus]|uniref:PRD domain-containing protein n=1 Tax=Streptomyces hygroscopicus TaxID=1912 RepID=UPI0033C94E40
MTIKRVIGNNAVLAIDEHDREFVALGRGVGFGVRAGVRLDSGKVEQVFLASEDAASSQLVELLSETPLVCVRAAARIADLAHEKLGLRATQALILPLADHLHFAMQRAADGTTMEFPLLWEVSQLYPKEFEVGRQAVEIANSVIRVVLDPDEAVALAMHLVNAQFASPGLGTTMQMTETMAQVFAIIESSFAVTINRHSMNAARFITHLRYVFARVAAGQQISDPHPTLFDAISNAHPEAMACAVKIRYRIEMAFKTSLTLDEAAYLGLHVARLVMDVRERNAK